MEIYNIETQVGTISRHIKHGELVAFRGTNTYLVCDAFNEDSVSNALQLKGKCDNPLVVYVANLSMANRYVHNISHEAYTTADRVWPSTVLLVLPAKKIIPNLVTRGLDSAVFSCPTEKVLRQISCLINSPLVLVKIDLAALEELNYDIAAVDCDLPFIRKPPIIFDGRDELRRIETEDPYFFAVP